MIDDLLPLPLLLLLLLRLLLLVLERDAIPGVVSDHEPLVLFFCVTVVFSLYK